jgi:hypothetical protein
MISLRSLFARASARDGAVVRQHESVMIVDCADCSIAGVAGHAWLLTAPEAAPGRLELDNEPYALRA